MGSTRRQPKSLGSESNTHSDSNDDKFGFQSGYGLTFEELEAFTKEFKELYFGTNDNEVWRPSIKEIKGEYWCIIEKPTDEVEVNYGDDLETGVFDSGLPLVLQICMQLLDFWSHGCILECAFHHFEEQPDLLHELERIVGNIWFRVLQMNDLCVSQLLNLILQGKACLNGISDHPRMVWQRRCKKVGVFGLGLVGHCIWDEKSWRIVGAFGNEKAFGIVVLGREFVVCRGVG
ncbi:hypothetical protein FXO37_00308 [Capsicum annuum]|nr:hypothetical protein FXO37_00308 [Capsicum annuum]